MATATELDVQTIESGIDAMDMAEAIFGSGIQVVSATYSGDPASAGLYSGADTTIPGIAPADSGVILSTGNAADFTNSDGSTNTNTAPDTGTDMPGGIDGDPLLDGVSGVATFDAALLDVSFIPDGDTLTMRFVFSSEEYLEYIRSGVNDAIGVWVNGTFVPMTATVSGASVDSINSTTNANLYVDNPADTDPYNTEMDGFTVVLSLKAPVIPGEINTLRIGIADGGDGTYDSNLLIAADSVQTHVLAVEDQIQITEGTSRTFDLLANDRDASELGLTISQINGQAITAGQTVTLLTGQDVTLNADGTVTISSLTAGTDVFTYQVTDGAGLVDTGFVTLTTTATPTADGIVEGTAGDDIIDIAYLDDPDGDLIDANDALGIGGTTGDGDYVIAGAGNDQVTGGAGNDVIFGGGDNDTLYGGAGDDALFGGTGINEIDGGAGNDTLHSGAEDDFLVGGDGNDSILAGSGADNIDGGTGADIIVAGDGNDTIYGGYDYLGPLDPSLVQYTTLSGSSQSVTGTFGNADFVASAYSESGDLAFADSGPILNGYWVGNDSSPETHTHNFSTEVAGVRLTINGLGTAETVTVVIDGWSLDLNDAIGWGWITFDDPSGTFVISPTGQITSTTDDPTAISDNTATLTVLSQLTSISLVTDGGDGAVYAIEVDSNPTFILIPDEGDRVDAGAGDDVVLAGEGSDTVSGGDGNDSIEGGFGDDSIDGGSGFDQIWGQDGADTIMAGGDGDVIFGGDGNDLIHAEAGNDYVDADYGDDTLFGGDGTDILQGSEGDDLVNGDADDDTLMGGFGLDTVYGGAGNDLILGNGNIVDLIQNGSFEDTTGMTATAWGWRGDDGTAPGWFTGTGGVIDIHHTGAGGPSDGANWLDTEGMPGVTTISQNILGVVDGAAYRIEFDAIDGPTDDNSLNVYWNGELLGTVDPGTFFHEGYIFDVIGGSGDGSNRLTFEALGPVDGTGIVIDSVNFWGPSTLVENTEADQLFGGDDADTLMGGGNDTVDGGEGGTDADVLVVDGIDQILYGGGNNESGTVTFADGTALTFANIEAILADGVLIEAPPPAVDGTTAADLIDTSYVDIDGDRVDSPDGLRDWVLAGDGNDTIAAGLGNDTIDAGGGDDLALFADDHGQDRLDGGSGFDTIDVSGITAPAGVFAVWTGDAQGNVTSAAGTVQFTSVEAINGTNESDILDASASALSGLTLSGGAGNDSIIGGSGGDLLFGGDGADTLQGGAGNDSIDLGAPDGSTDVIRVADGGGADTITGFESPIDNGDGTFTGRDLLDVSGLNRLDASGISVDDVTVSDTIGDGSGDAILTFPDGTSVVLSGVDPALAANPAWLEAIGLPAAPTGIVDGTSASDLMGFGFTDSQGDQIEGTDGLNDTIQAYGGDDTVQAGQGDDSVFGDDGADWLFGWEGNDTLFGGAGADMVDGDSGDDSLAGDAGDDTLVGDEGTDWLDGGDGADSLFGGIGNDTLIGGDGADALWGGDDADLFFGGIGDQIYGGDGGLNQDTLDLSPYGKASTNVLFGGGGSGTVEFLDINGDVAGTLTFSGIEAVIPCFTPGTLILVLGGERPVESLVVGDLVMTRDDGFQPITWIGRRDLSADLTALEPRFCPVRIRAGALGPDVPRTDLVVSPQHRVLMSGKRADLLFGESEVLIAARHLLGLPGVSLLPPGPVSYIHLMCERHQIVQSNGAWTESYQPGIATMNAMEDDTRAELLALFPSLAESGLSYPAARRSLKAHEAHVMLRS